MSNLNPTASTPLLLARWSVTTTFAEKQAHRDSKPYFDTPRTLHEGVCLGNEQRALAQHSLLKGKPDANLQKSIDFENWLAKLVNKTPAQFRREPSQPDRGLE